MDPKDCTKGTKVTYWPIRWAEGDFEGPPIHTVVSHDAYEVTSAGWVCFVYGKAGYVLCSHLEPRTVTTPQELLLEQRRDRLFVQEVINDLVRRHGLRPGDKAFDLLVDWSRELRDKTHMRGRTKRTFIAQVGKHLW